MTEKEKQLLSQHTALWRRLILGKKYNAAEGIHHVYISDCAIYNTLMKDDEIISHLQRNRRKSEMNCHATAL